jgi:hypothetical protein
MLDWQTIQRRGRRKVLRASRDPDAQARLAAEALMPAKQAWHRRTRPATQKRIETPAEAVPLVHLKPPANIPRLEAPQTARCSGSRYSFLASLPRELRDMIYLYAVDYPCCRTLFDTYYRQDCNPRQGRQKRVDLYTPAVLLLCRQITQEALESLRLRPFVIDRLPPWVFGHDRPLPITDFISIPTLQSVAFVEFKVTFGEGKYGSGHVWLDVLKDILAAWSERNSLVELRVMFKLAHLDNPNLWYQELDAYESLVEQINYLEFRHASRPGTVRYEHWVLDFVYAYRTGYRSRSSTRPT